MHEQKWATDFEVELSETLAIEAILEEAGFNNATVLTIQDQDGSLSHVISCPKEDRNNIKATLISKKYRVAGITKSKGNTASFIII